MKIVVAPQSFKGSLAAREVAEAIERGIRRVVPRADIFVLPMADGGEGTVDALVYSTGGRFMKCEVTGPLGDKVEANWGILGDGATAVLEMAAASGLILVAPEKRNPLVATTYGTGQLIKAALDADCRRLIIGIGGSATNDGGAGMAQALGAQLTDSDGRELAPGGAALARLNHIDVSGMDSRIKECRITIASDVTNTLCGTEGASWVYGPQKGATEDMCRQLDKALENYAAVIRKDLGIDIMDMPGAGAAGGLGAGLAVFLGAELVPGIDIVSEAAGLAEHLKGATLVFTGEGRLDSQTMFGKAVAGVTARAKEAGVPVVALTGGIAGDMSYLYEQGISSILCIAPGPISVEESQGKASQLITDTAERAMRLIMINPVNQP